MFLVFCFERSVEVVRVRGHPTTRPVGYLQLVKPCSRGWYQVKLNVVQLKHDSRRGLIDWRAQRNRLLLIHRGEGKRQEIAGT